MHGDATLAHRQHDEERDHGQGVATRRRGVYVPSPEDALERRKHRAPDRDHHEKAEIGDNRLFDGRSLGERHLRPYMLRGIQWASQAQINQPMATATYTAERSKKVSNSENRAIGARPAESR